MSNKVWTQRLDPWVTSKPTYWTTSFSFSVPKMDTRNSDLVTFFYDVIRILINYGNSVSSYLLHIVFNLTFSRFLIVFAKTISCISGYKYASINFFCPHSFIRCIENKRTRVVLDFASLFSCYTQICSLSSGAVSLLFLLCLLASTF